MNDAIIVALISASASLLGAYLTGRSTLDKMSHELDKAVALLQQENDVMKCDLKEHNNYAKMYSETMPVVQQQINSINKRLDKIEGKLSI